MAWKLKKSKAAVDEMPGSSEDDQSPNAAVSTSQYDRPGSNGSQDSDYSDFNGSERTVMLLDDSDYIPGLIPSAPTTHAPQSTVNDSTDLFPVTSDEDLDRYLRGEHTFDGSPLSSETSGGVDIDAVETHSAPTAEADETVNVGSLINFDDTSFHSGAIELDASPSSVAAHVAHDTTMHSGPIELDELPTNLAKLDADDTPVHVPPIDVDEPPVAAAHVSVDESPIAPIADLDVLPVSSARIDLIEEPEVASPPTDKTGHSIDAVADVPVQAMNNGLGAHRLIDAPDEDGDFLASALNASDDAVASLRTAAEDKPAQPVAAPESPAQPAGAHPAGAANMENWDLDAFAPYQPPGGVAAPLAEPAAAIATGSVPADETLAGAMSISRLVVRLGQFSASYELTKGETTIGRPDPRTSVFPDVAVEWDDAVSRNHCRVLHKADGDYVEDTGSTNGTRHNDKPLAPYKPVRLADGDRIGVGEKTEISYLA